MGVKTGACMTLVRRPEGKNHLEELGIDENITVKCIFKKWDGRHGLD
jgi:hypothetical protein